jgi:hypothetical protein
LLLRKDACGHWNCCYECSNSITSLLVDKAGFLARKQLEKEYPEMPHPNPSLLCPRHFYYGTDIDNKDDPERTKHNNWHHMEDHSMIALSIAADPMKTSNKEDLAMTKQVKTEFTQRQYHYHVYQSQLTPQNKENNPPSQKKSNERIATSPPLSLDNNDGSMFSVGYANVTTTTKLH